jgi:pimeloyl-ACP methyl ester carboxylesterase
MCPLRHASSALAVAVLLFAVGLGTPRAASPVADAAQGDFAGLVDIGGGRRPYIECRGSGSPAVVLEAGYRSSARIWSEDLHQSGAPRPMVLAGVAAFTRVCAYDRPGTVAPLNDDVRQSRSDPVAMPRTAMDAVADLHALLRAAGVPGSYVFAGHSLGGLFVRLYASTYPRDVLGLVLVDAYSETLETLLTPERWEALVRLNVRSGSDTVKTIPSYGDLETIGYGKDNLFIFLDVHRPCKVTDNRAAVDFATCMRELTDVHFPNAERIRVVLDNLSTHSAGALYQAFPACEARRVLRRLEFHFVPKHASWLNMVEIEIGVLRSQCLDRRIATQQQLKSEIAVWERQRNAAKARIKWMFTTDKARAKMGRAYPQLANISQPRP